MNKIWVFWRACMISIYGQRQANCANWMLRYFIAERKNIDISQIHIEGFTLSTYTFAKCVLRDLHKPIFTYPPLTSPSHICSLGNHSHYLLDNEMLFPRTYSSGIQDIATRPYHIPYAIWWLCLIPRGRFVCYVYYEIWLLTATDSNCANS